MTSQKYHYKSFHICKLTNYIEVERQLLASIIVDVIVIIFYKTIQNSELYFITKMLGFFSLFYFGILIFLFAILYSGISK